MTLADTRMPGALPLRGPGAAAPDRTPDRERLSIFVVLYLVCVALPLFFPLGPLSMSNLKLLLLILTAPLMLRTWMGHFGRVRLPDILFPAFIFWTFLAVLKNNPSMAVESTGSAGTEMLGGYFVGRAFIRTPGQFLAFARGLMVTVLFLMPFAIHEALTGRLLLGEILAMVPGMKSVTTNVSNMRFGLDRAQTVFVHPIHFGLFCSMALSLAFVSLKDEMPKMRRYVLSLVMAITGCLSLSSGALLAILLFAGLVTWRWMLDRVKARWWVLIGLFALAYVVVDLLSNRTPLRVFMSYATFSPETAYWRGLILQYGMENVWANPLFGLGFNDWARPGFMITSSVDNFWLLTAMRYGIPAFVMLVIGMLVPLLRIMFRTFDADPRLMNIRLAWVFTFVGLSFTLSTVHVWGTAFSLVFVMFGAGLWLISAEPAAPREEGDGAGAEPAGTRTTRFSRFAPAAIRRTSGQTERKPDRFRR
ncbi:O-antigen ligase family protein [Tropicibacter sp. S64]|uniref:O-antigen ligase family protein n=1 Tax=Tropicibacter sp. S64 TaxID=3415122 RepID=UPI003C7A3B1C